MRTLPALIVYTALTFVIMENLADALSEGEMCENCQKVLYHAFLYYRVQTTKRLLKHKLKHLCKRYFEYRRHCLITMLPKVDLIWENMEKVLDEDRASEPVSFKPYGTCATIKECDKDHSPLVTFGPEDGGGMLEAGVITASSTDSNTTTATSSSWSATITTTPDESESEAMLMLDFMF
uniref:Saposin B-type domain-containing protein n=1 Tax=Globodera pallida TaxID=36090 RepID=A0A183CEC2_GLOPA